MVAVLVELVRLAQRQKHALAHRPGLGARPLHVRAHPFEQHDVLVVAEAGDGVVVANAAAQPLRHLLEQLVAHRMPEGVVE